MVSWLYFLALITKCFSVVWCTFGGSVYYKFITILYKYVYCDYGLKGVELDVKSILWNLFMICLGDWNVCLYDIMTKWSICLCKAY